MAQTKDLHQAPLILLDRSEVERRVRKSRSTIYREVAAGSFPAPLQTGARSVRWLESDVNGWIESRSTGIRAANCNTPRQAAK